MNGAGLNTIIVNVLVLIFSVVFHEVAHGWMALRQGDETALRMGRLTLNPLPHIDPMGSILLPALLAISQVPVMFGWAKPVPVNVHNLRNPRDDHPKVAAAGPASNLLLALVSAVLLGVVAGLGARMDPGASTLPTGAAFFRDLFGAGILINVFLALFNLVPLPPLDGSWILARFLPAHLAFRYLELRRYGMLIVIGYIVLVQLTPLGNVAFAPVLGVYHFFLGVAQFIAELFLP